MTKFQMILMGLFAVLVIVGVIVFSMYKGSTKAAVTVTVWGTVPQITFNNIIAKTSLYQSKEYTVQYVEKSAENFDSDFIEALASGTGPDVFMLPSDKILKHQNKIFPIPYNVFTARQFKDSFIAGAEVYMSPEGTLAIPVSVDPMVMYWNRSIFTGAKLTQPPGFWDEFYNLANVITKKDGALNISRSAVALGEFNNIPHAKEIVLGLAMQAGTPVTTWVDGKVASVFGELMGKPIMPAEAAVNFYTEFSNPSKPSYSWNRSLPDSTNYFLSGDLALYFGFASEIGNLQFKNPNLDFDVAPVPVSREGGRDVSYANFNALAITKSSKNINAAYTVVSILTGGDGAKAFAEALKLPPARRDLLNAKQTDAYQSVFYNSAIRGATWLDPSPLETDSIVKDMIESITSGRARTGDAVAKAGREIASLLSKK
jgi:ABC-type glycerol-3-phosphate transport system substrate-binding protein